MAPGQSANGDEAVDEGLMAFVVLLRFLGKPSLFWTIAFLVAFAILAPQAWANDRGSIFGRELGRVALGGYAQSIAWSPDQKRIVVVVESLGSERRRIISIDAARRSIEWSVDGQDTRQSKVAFLRGGDLIVTRSLAPINLEGLNWDMTLSILDASSGRIVRHVPSHAPKSKANHRARDFSLSEDGNVIAVLVGLPQVLGFDTRTWTPTWRIGSPREVPAGEGVGRRVALDVRRNNVAVAVAARHGGPVQNWDLLRNAQRQSFVPYNSGLSLMVLDTSTGTLFTGGDGILRGSLSNNPSVPRWIEDDPVTLVKAWDPNTGRLIMTYDGPGQEVDGLALSPSGRYLFASKSRNISPPPRAKDAHVIAWEVPTGRMIALSNYGQGTPGCVAFSPDGRQVAISDGHTLQIIELDSRLFP